MCSCRVWIRLITAYLLYARELWQNNALSLQFWCLSNALTLWVCALDASKFQCMCIILSQFSRKSKYAVIIYNSVILTTSFLWHETEAVNKKKAYFHNFSRFQFCIYKLCMIMCVPLLHIYCMELILHGINYCRREFLWKLLSFHTEISSA